MDKYKQEVDLRDLRMAWLEYQSGKDATDLLEQELGVLLENNPAPRLTPGDGIEIERMLQAAKENFGDDRFEFEFEPGERMMTLIFRGKGEYEEDADFEMEVLEWLTACGLLLNGGDWICEDVSWDSEDGEDCWKRCPHFWDDPEWEAES